MRYGKRSSNSSIFSSLPVFIIAILAFVFMIKVSWSMYEKAILSKDKLAQAEAALNDINSRKNELQKKVSFLSTDQGVQSEARTKFRLAEEGESVAVIIGDEQSKKTVSTTTIERKKSLWRRLIGMIGF